MLASTELQNPSAGWASPHRLVLVELSDAIRVLALGVGPLPSAGSTVSIERDGEKYLVRTEPAADR